MKDAGNLRLQGVDFGEDALFLLVGDAGLPLEGEDVDEHALSVTKGP